MSMTSQSNLQTARCDLRLIEKTQGLDDGGASRLGKSFTMYGKHCVLHDEIACLRTFSKTYSKG